jgi:hypothetical protein
LPSTNNSAPAAKAPVAHAPAQEDVEMRQTGTSNGTVRKYLKHEMPVIDYFALSRHPYLHHRTVVPLFSLQHTCRPRKMLKCVKHVAL